MVETKQSFGEESGGPGPLPSQSFWKVFGPNFLAFGIGLTLAYYLKWELTDLVWSLWLTSLVVGYATILSTVGGAAWFGCKLIKHPDFDSTFLVPAVAIALGFGLFYLGFFSLHFCGFHAGHSVFLNSFFPVEGLPGEGFGNAFMNPFLLWKQVFQYLIVPYGAFLIPAFIVDRHHLLAPFKAASQLMGEGPKNKAHLKKNSSLLGKGMMRPYANVVRMHLLIFFFAACQFLKVDSFLIYTVVSACFKKNEHRWKRTNHY